MHNGGEYRPDKTIDPTGPYAICPVCGYRHSFLWLPLLIVSGASGAGKTSVCQALLGKTAEIVLLDSDILWRPEFNTPENNYRDFFETWLRWVRTSRNRADLSCCLARALAFRTTSNTV